MTPDHLSLLWFYTTPISKIPEDMQVRYLELRSEERPAVLNWLIENDYLFRDSIYRPTPKGWMAMHKPDNKVRVLIRRKA